MEELKEGWAESYGSRKWHYFVDGRSLCRNFGLIGNELLKEGQDNSPDNCTACKRELARKYSM